jgi:hypothetical protein
MAPESVSFRITRNTEDLAQTIHALSQRLVTLEQRLELMQLQLDHRLAEHAEPDIEALASLDNVERLLHDCRCLLGLDGSEDETAVQQPLQSEFGSIPTEEFGADPMGMEEMGMKDDQADRDQFDPMVDPPGAAEQEGRDFGTLTEPFGQAA